MELIDKIIECVCEVSNIELEALQGSCHKRELADARAIVAHLATKHTKDNLRQIGEKIGVKHSTVIWQKNKCLDLMYSDKKFAAKVLKVEEIFNLEPV